ncbi:MAG: S8 family peptidase [Gemmatimonadetes bacterium]|nr:S8 family peptidase [Gemmatimonadota bacterium]
MLPAAALILLTLACGDDSEPLSSSAPPPSGSEATLQATPEGVIPGRFIVTLRPYAGRPGTDAASVARAVAATHGATPDFVYTHALHGFAGRLSEAARAGLLRDARVARVEPDGIARISTTQSGATWGLDRIDQRALPLSGSYTYAARGAGVTAYIIDTGIRLSHSEFGSRATSGFDAVDGGSANDCNGHGTHVAGTTGGATYGVAKGVALVAVRVLNCGGSGTWSGVIAGIDWVTGDHRPGESAVANMSLGGPTNSSVDEAVRRSIADGVSYAIAAGNDGQDACRFTPARVAEAMTTGSSTRTDERSSFSNRGNCVDWFAPGSGITSAWNGNDNQTNTISGTSMAAPHTAGVAALYLDDNPGASPSSVRAALYGLTTKGIVKRARSANNDLLFTSF